MPYSAPNETAPAEENRPMSAPTPEKHKTSSLSPLALDMAQDGPVRLERNGKPFAVLISTQEYEHLTRLEDAYWADRADATLAEDDFMSAEESEAFLEGILNAPD